jgi:hypothetical protein
MAGDKQDFEPPANLDEEFEVTLRETIKILSDEEEPPQGIHLSVHHGDSLAFTTGMSPELVSGNGPTQPAVDMLAQHLLTVYRQTEGMSLDELALFAADVAKEDLGGEGSE